MIMKKEYIYIGGLSLVVRVCVCVCVWVVPFFVHIYISLFEYSD